jgi:hypothetical protein
LRTLSSWPRRLYQPILLPFLRLGICDQLLFTLDYRPG